MFVGIDLGTSSVKAVWMDPAGKVRTSASAPLSLSQPQPRWSEQDPGEWWLATLAAVDALLTQARHEGLNPADVRGIGLSGQMHGATLLDANDRVLRPAILWNDGRSDAECRALERSADVHGITGNLAMPGFTAPKLLWVRQHEPAVFDRIAKVLLPKDYLRLCLTGDYATDASDAAGTLWLDVAHRQWSDALLAATGLEREHMPRVLEGNAASGTLRAELATRWGLRCGVAVAAGGGDNAAGALGIGIVGAGQAMLSLGTSGVYFAVSDGFLSHPQQAVHSFCHALPHTWHLMSVMLSAASCVDFTARLCGYADAPHLLADAQTVAANPRAPWFLPYLNGERTPHNDAHARGAFIGLDGTHTRADLARATLEGVGLGLLDGVKAVESAGLQSERVAVIGGGSRSAFWMQMLADILGKPLEQRTGGDVGPALGAARLAHLAVEPQADLTQVCAPPPLQAVFEPNLTRHAFFRDVRHPAFRTLYTQLRPVFSGRSGVDADGSP